ncbi:penicillin-binding protein [Metabacillus malikii]|uniref:serine-type D-Ala-D-Ala carboxypeptidase n=1 Tax=Metabacillus malikii TaxID=1504265 RepID=A0ABT9ZCK4_9BACI|nr:penicillin-binding protein [Metabacillus malikii]MDQ0229308.1 penicillin-binding protein 2B [Metabacillus malikii]
MKLKKSPFMNRGAGILSLLFLGFFIVILARFFYIMVTGNIHGVNLVDTREKLITNQELLEGKNGDILTRDGSVIATDSHVYTIAAIINQNSDNHVKDIPKTSEKLASVLDVDKEKIEQMLTENKNKYQVELGNIGRNVSFSQMKEISEMELPGIVFTPDLKRIYPFGDFASHVVGITNFDGEGISGIEKQFSKDLAGKDGYIKVKNDKQGLRLPTEEIESKPPVNGHNIVTTLDTNIQTLLDDSMNQVIEEYAPEKIIGIVMNAETGEIVAMSNRPSIYPNENGEVNYLNYGISYPFEPGSTMKIFTLAAAINDGVYNGKEKYKSGAIEISGETIHDHNDEGWGTITFNKGVELSSNVAFTIIAKDKLGYERFYEYLHEFGFDSKTGIDLSSEENGKLLNNYPIEKATTSFGQGSIVTPIQLVTAASAIANDGKMMKPYIIKGITDEKGKTVKEFTPSVINAPITAETALATRKLLTSVVNDGTGTLFQLNDYQVAGKTGTAQIPDGKGKYQTGRNNYIFSFLGMAPVDDPKLVVYVAVEKPNLKPDQIGAQPVSEIFNSVMDYGLKKMDATADKGKVIGEKQKSATIKLPNYESHQVSETTKAIKENGLTPIIIGRGTEVVETFPGKDTELMEGSKVLIKTTGEPTMPNLNGWSLADVMKLGKIANLKVTHKGEGFVNMQSIAPDEVIKDKTLSISLTKSVN